MLALSCSAAFPWKSQAVQGLPAARTFAARGIFFLILLFSGGRIVTELPWVVPCEAGLNIQASQDESGPA